MDILIKSPYKINKFGLKLLSQVKFSRECGIVHIAMPHSSKLSRTTTLTTAKMDMADGGHLEF